jgi:hypothetical protein
MKNNQFDRLRGGIWVYFGVDSRSEIRKKLSRFCTKVRRQNKKLDRWELELLIFQAYEMETCQNKSFDKLTKISVGFDNDELYIYHNGYKIRHKFTMEKFVEGVGSHWKSYFFALVV